MNRQGRSGDGSGLFSDCSNAGRWGPNDERGTLNFITSEKRKRAASLVVEGETVALGKPIDTAQSAVTPRPAWHVMHLETDRPYASADSLSIQIHGLGVTHLDALGHMFFEGHGYNRTRQEDVVLGSGLARNSVAAMRDGIFTRGVFLDVAAATDRRWLEPGEEVTPEVLEAAERRAGVDVGTGDVVVVHTGLEEREQVQGAEDPEHRAGLGVTCVPWLFDREVAVYTGDCIEVLPQPPGPFGLPLHQIGIAAMGLVLLDSPRLAELAETVRRLERAEFLFTAAPLVLPGGTGCPVNPLAVF